MTDEQQWNRLKEEYHFVTSGFLNFLQTTSVNDLSNPDIIKELVSMRYKMVDTFLHIFMFIEDAGNDTFLKSLCDKK